MTDNDTMDAAAQAAELELIANPLWTVKEVAQWWAKHYLAAGHKRLARALLKLK